MTTKNHHTHPENQRPLDYLTVNCPGCIKERAEEAQMGPSGERIDAAFQITDGSTKERTVLAAVVLGVIAFVAVLVWSMVVQAHEPDESDDPTEWRRLCYNLYLGPNAVSNPSGSYIDCMAMGS